MKSRIIKLQVAYTQTGIPKLEHALQVPQLLLCHQALYVLIAQILGLVRDHTALQVMKCTVSKRKRGAQLKL